MLVPLPQYFLLEGLTTEDSAITLGAFAWGIFPQKTDNHARVAPTKPYPYLLSPVAKKLRKGDIGLPSVHQSIHPYALNKFKSFGRNLMNTSHSFFPASWVFCKVPVHCQVASFPGISYIIHTC